MHDSMNISKIEFISYKDELTANNNATDLECLDVYAELRLRYLITTKQRVSITMICHNRDEETLQFKDVHPHKIMNTFSQLKQSNQRFTPQDDCISTKDTNDIKIVHIMHCHRPEAFYQILTC